MRHFLFVYIVFSVISTSFSYYIRRQTSENTLSSPNDVLTTSETETVSDTEAWDDFPTYSTTASSFTETPYTDTTSNTTEIRDNSSTYNTTIPTFTETLYAIISSTTETSLETQTWNEFSIYSSTISPFTETLYASIDTISTIDILSTPESNSDDSTKVFWTPSIIFPISMSLSMNTDISKAIYNNSASELVMALKIFWSPSVNFTISSNFSMNTNISKIVYNSSTTKGEIKVAMDAEDFRNSTVTPEISSASSRNTSNITNNTTNTVLFTQEQIKLTDYKQELNTIETETNEPKLPYCGQRFTRIPRIIGGIRSQAGEFPWMVSVRVLTSHFCGGVIINKDWILTAAHCVRRFATRYWRIRLGGHDVHIDQFRPQWDIQVSKVILHPKFGSPARYSNDIALMKLQRSIKSSDFAAPICLPENLEETFDGATATVVGWGRTNENIEEKTAFLQKASIPVINNSLCSEWYKRVHYGYIRVRDYHICAGLREGGRDACKGDSGGPLVFENKNGRFTLIGITSAGVGCGRSQLPGIYSRATHFVPWILKVTGGYTDWPLEEDYDDDYDDDGDDY